MLLARLDYNQWGNTPISTEIVRIVENDNPSLLPYSSMVVFNNRLLMSCQPFQTARGVCHAALASLNFDPISTLQGKADSIWEGEWTGLSVLQLVTGFFAGVKRCFAICLDEATLSNIEVHEILLDIEQTVDDASTNVTWSIESPMLFARENTNTLETVSSNAQLSRIYKRLVDGEVYIDRLTIAGVQLQAFYRVDQNPDWTPWYSTTINYKPNDSGYRPRIGLGQPNPQAYDDANNRPLREGYDFQVMLQFTGSCRFLGGRFAADIIPQPEFAKPV
jgi:hypothetical protein